MIAFESTGKAFSSVSSLKINIHLVTSVHVDLILSECRRLFSIVDHSDPDQCVFSALLWRFRLTIVSTLLPFDSKVLGIAAQLDHIYAASYCLPAGEMNAELAKSVSCLLAGSSNPKHALLFSMMQDLVGNESCAVLLPRFQARFRERAVHEQALVAGYGEKVTIVSTGNHETNWGAARVVMPSGTWSWSGRLLFDLVYSGITSQLDVLTYKGESFVVPKRPTLPTTEFFAALYTPTNIVIERRGQRANLATSEELEDTDTDSDPTLKVRWDNIHGESRTLSSGLVEARYVVFADGNGTFLREDGEVSLIPDHHAVGASAEESIQTVRVGMLCGGELVALRSGHSDRLLDEASAEIQGERGIEGIESEAVDWKKGMQKFLLTHSITDIQNYLGSRDLAFRHAQTIRGWVDHQIIGPAEKEYFFAIINMLASAGCLGPNSEKWESYALSRWEKMQTLRGIKQKAGNMIRRDLFAKLRDRISKGGAFGNKTLITVGEGMVHMAVLRVAEVDDFPAFVMPSRIGRLDNLEDSPWLV